MNSIFTYHCMRILIAGLIITLISACATRGLVSAGSTVKVFDMQITSDLDWARYQYPRNQIWTIDGIPLNRLLIFGRIRPNEHVFLGRRERKSRPDGPWFRPGMRPDELRDIILDGLRENGWTNIAAQQLRPAKFGSVNGLRFEMDLISGSGLIYRGRVAAAEYDGKLNVLVWFAAKEHYHDRDSAAVDQLMNNVRFL